MAPTGRQGEAGEPHRTPAQLAAALRQLAGETPTPQAIAAGERNPGRLAENVHAEPTDAPAPLLTSAADEDLASTTGDAPDHGEVPAGRAVGEGGAEPGAETSVPAASTEPGRPAQTEGSPRDPEAVTAQLAGGDEVAAAALGEHEELAPLEEDPEIDEPAALAPEHGDAYASPDFPAARRMQAAAATPWTELAWQRPGADVAQQRARRIRLGISALVTAIAVTLAIVALAEFTANPSPVRTADHNSPVSTATATSSSTTASSTTSASTSKTSTKARKRRRGTASKRKTKRRTTRRRGASAHKRSTRNSTTRKNRGHPGRKTAKHG